MARGRKRDDTSPRSHAREIQRAFCARKAAHVQALEQRILELEEENRSLCDALNVPHVERDPLGTGPTGRKKFASAKGAAFSTRSYRPLPASPVWKPFSVSRTILSVPISPSAAVQATELGMSPHSERQDLVWPIIRSPPIHLPPIRLPSIHLPLIHLPHEIEAETGADQGEDLGLKLLPHMALGSRTVVHSRPRSLSLRLSGNGRPTQLSLGNSGRPRSPPIVVYDAPPARSSFDSYSSPAWKAASLSPAILSASLHRKVEVQATKLGISPDFQHGLDLPLIFSAPIYLQEKMQNEIGAQEHEEGALQFKPLSPMLAPVSHVAHSSSSPYSMMHHPFPLSSYPSSSNSPLSSGSFFDPTCVYDSYDRPCSPSCSEQQPQWSSYLRM